MCKAARKQTDRVRAILEDLYFENESWLRVGYSIHYMTRETRTKTAGTIAAHANAVYNGREEPRPWLLKALGVHKPKIGLYINLSNIGDGKDLAHRFKSRAGEIGMSYPDFLRYLLDGDDNNE